MATYDDTQKALANESRRNELSTLIAHLEGVAEATAMLTGQANTLNSDTQISLSNARAQLVALNKGAGPGITADFGPKSTITQLVETERFAAKDASIAFVKANPTCSEQDAAAAWNAAALASHPAFNFVIQDGLVMSALYRANLVSVNLIAENSWVAHRQFILNTETLALESL